MVNYNNGKIYKIESHLGDKVYIGSTTKEYLSQRMTTHRSNYNSWKQGKFSEVTSFVLFEEYGIENCSMVLLELCPCESKDELHSREAHYIRNIKCVNKMIPGRTKKEYREDKKDAIKAKDIQYRNENKPKKKDYDTQYRKLNEERLSEYRESNKERIKSTFKAYYEANRDEINRKKRERRAAKKLEQQSTQ